MLNACNYLVAFYGGDLYSEGLTSKVTLWSMCYGIYNRKQVQNVIAMLSYKHSFNCAIFETFFNGKIQRKCCLF